MTDTLHKHELKWWQLAATAILAPLLAGSIQTAWVLTHGTQSRYYQAQFYPHQGVVDLAVGIPVVVGVEALITFFAVWIAMKRRPSLRWPAFLICCALWTYVAFIGIGAVS